LTSQAFGAGRQGEVAAMLTRALMIGFVGGALVLCLQAPLFWLALKLAPASPQVESMARDYLWIRVWSAPAAIAIYGVTGWLIGLQRTRAVLLIQLWMNGLIMLLDVWFVLGLGWGGEGVAFATFLAEWSGLALALFMCRSAFRQPAWHDWERVFDRAQLRQIAVVNSDILLRSLMLQAIFMSFLFLAADFGDVTLAANQVLMQFLHITAYALDGFAFAAEALVGQALGARSREQLRQGAVLASIWGGVSVIGMALAFALFGGAIIDLLTTAEDVRLEARSYLIWMVLSPLLGVGAWMLDGIFIGATRSRDMRDMMFLSFVIYVASVAALVPMFGNHGLWGALLISFVARGATLAWKYPALEASSGHG
jgi:MATE family multidrug resistance protein